MTFKDVIWKNVKGSFKKYLAYFLSGSFSIMLFFMYSALFLNKSLMENDENDVFSYLFPITIVAITLFSIFFINYAHSAFIKGRNKEFGIYISLGVNSKDLRTIINLENSIIGAAALLTGMGVGALFSRLFQMVILKLIHIKDITFYMDYKPFVLTFTVFLSIFATVAVRTFFKMRKIDISGLLREARRSEGRDYSKKDLVFGGLGLIIMALSILFLVVIAKNSDLNTNPAVLMSYMITAFLGVYLALSYGGNLILHLIKKTKYYYKNMLSITELQYKFNQNRKIIFILSVLSTMTIFLVASPFALLTLSETIAEKDKHHLEYVETDTLNKLPKDTLNRILNEQKMVSNTTVKFVYFSTSKTSDNLKYWKPVVSVSEYNMLTGSNIKLEKGQAYNLIVDWKPGNNGINPGSTHEFYIGNVTYRYRFTASQKGNWIAGKTPFPSNSVVIVSDEDYDSVMADITDHNIAYYHLINYKDWRKCKGLFTSLKDAFGNNGLKVGNIIDTYESLKGGYSTFLFITTVMGIMFFVAGGSVLYFKQFTELTEVKITFRKLFKIGITDKEMKGVIGKELCVIFFLPLVFGAFLGISLMYLTTYIMGGGFLIKEFMSNAIKVVIIYFIFQGAFYLITRNKYIQEIGKA